ncbi:MAG: SDR family NAD(P)-dependent oxidoreductase [Clostridia bacterium]|nr:SDR family NAD(P)-dependent oxidoreductase [Clostridia bacterium]
MSEYLVTGAAGGMGRAVTRALLEKGHAVFGLDIAPEAPFRDEGFHYICADVRSAGSIDAAFDIISGACGGLDGIICLAGIYDLGSLIEMTEDRFLRDFDVNLFGAFRVCRTFFPILRRTGRIVIISSELAPLDPLPFTGIYAVTKSALDGYASALRAELQLLGIKVVTVRPGAVDTGMLPASVGKLNDFCEKTELYGLNAARFRRIVDSVETRSVPAEKLARLVTKILSARSPRPVYSINRNPLLLLLNALPRRARLFILRKILAPK